MQQSTTLPVTPAQYAKALQRAHDEHLYSHGPFRLDENTLAITVAHPETPGAHYTVRLQRGCHVLSCNCTAGANGIFCKHRAFAHEHLVTFVRYGIQPWSIQTPLPQFCTVCGLTTDERTAVCPLGHDNSEPSTYDDGVDLAERWA